MTYHGMAYGVFSDVGLSYSSNNLPCRTSDFTLATDGSIINVGYADVYGYVNTAPEGVASLNANGSVGDLNWVHSGTSGIEPGTRGDKHEHHILFQKSPKPGNEWLANQLAPRSRSPAQKCVL